MTYIALRSTNIQGINYDEKSQDLTVVFKNGAQYTYQSVPKDLAEAFAKTSSPRRFLNQFVHGKFSVGQSSGPPPKKIHPPRHNSKRRYK